MEQEFDLWNKKVSILGYWQRVHIEYVHNQLIVYSSVHRNILHRFCIREIELRKSKKSQRAFNIFYGFTKVTLRASSVQVKIKWILFLTEELKREKKSLILTSLVTNEEIENHNPNKMAKLANEWIQKSSLEKLVQKMNNLQSQI
jgi:hypothetical protein